MKSLSVLYARCAWYLVKKKQLKTIYQRSFQLWQNLKMQHGMLLLSV